MKITIQKAKPKVSPPPTVTIAGITVSQLKMLASAMDMYIGDRGTSNSAAYDLFYALNTAFAETCER